MTQGDLKVKNPEANYSIVVAEKGEKAVAVAYSESVLEIGKPYSRLSFINGTSGNKLYIENNGADCAYHCRVYDCTGKVVLENEVMLTSGINAFEVPFSGLMKFRKKLGV